MILLALGIDQADQIALAVVAVAQHVTGGVDALGDLTLPVSVAVLGCFAFRVGVSGDQPESI